MNTIVPLLERKAILLSMSTLPSYLGVEL